MNLKLRRIVAWLDYNLQISIAYIKLDHPHK